MTYEEWSKKNSRVPHSRNIWNTAQKNYPFPICDEAMREEIIKDAMSILSITRAEAEEYAETHGPAIVDAMWEAKNNYICSVLW